VVTGTSFNAQIGPRLGADKCRIVNDPMRTR
jgi:hypothetical protein